MPTSMNQESKHSGFYQFLWQHPVINPMPPANPAPVPLNKVIGCIMDGILFALIRILYLYNYRYLWGQPVHFCRCVEKHKHPCVKCSLEFLMCQCKLAGTADETLEQKITFITGSFLMQQEITIYLEAPKHL